MGCFGSRRRCRLAGQHVLVTGGSKGIGLAIARGAVARGAAAVTVVARDKAALVEALAELQGVADAAAAAQRSRKAGAPRQPTLQALSADTCDSDAVTRAFAQAEATAGPIDVLVCNAGLSIPGMFVEQDVAAFERQVQVNYLGSVRCIKAALPGMLRRRRGRIVLISSALGVLGFGGYSSYAPTKWALRGLGDCLRNELAGTGVEVSVGYPPDTETPGYEAENATKPPLCKDVNAALGSSLFPADQVACSLLRGVERGAYHLPSPDLGQNMLVASMASLTPGPLPLAAMVLLGPLLPPVMSVLTWLADRAARRANARAAAAAAAGADADQRR